MHKNGNHLRVGPLAIVAVEEVGQRVHAGPELPLPRTRHQAAFGENAPELGWRPLAGSIVKRQSDIGRQRTRAGPMAPFDRTSSSFSTALRPTEELFAHAARLEAPPLVWEGPRRDPFWIARVDLTWHTRGPQSLQDVAGTG
jgi:hypothetical protein